MNIDLIREISIEDKAISHFSSFTLQQAFNAHHYFELRFNHDQIGEPGLITLDDSRDFVGKTLSATFGHAMGTLQKFSGLVTKVELSQSHGYHGVLIVSGYSPTILIDRGADLGSYLDKTLDDIVTLATNDTPQNDLRIVSNATRKNPIDYVIQYRESDFDFLNRLSGEYYEWFYYDGENLNFGKPDQQKEVSLFYGRDLHNLQYAMGVAPIKNKRFAYNPKQDEMLQAETSGNAEGRPDLVHAINASNSMFSKTFNQPASIRVENNNDITNHVEYQEKANISKLLKVSATGDNPEVGIGTIVDITMSIKKDLSFNTESLGQFLVTSISHSIDERGHYQNTFEGVVSTTERLAADDFQRPNPDMQLADVIDNNDPQGSGRIKVKFKWACQTNDVTEWLRVVTPDAGSSESVSKNRGLVFIPEIGDQVLVSFEEGNIARPIVLGSVFHGKSGSGGSSSNNNKSITSKSGHTFTMDDAGGMLLKDRSGLNHISIDGTNAITVTSDNNVTLQTGNVMIIMDKENDKIIIQAKNIEIRAADDFKLTGDGAPSKNGSIEFQEKLSITSKNELFMVGETSAKLNSESVNIVGSKTFIDGKPVKINS